MWDKAAGDDTRMEPTAADPSKQDELYSFYTYMEDFLGLFKVYFCLCTVRRDITAVDITHKLPRVVTSG